MRKIRYHANCNTVSTARISDVGLKYGKLTCQAENVPHGDGQAFQPAEQVLAQASTKLQDATINECVPNAEKAM